MTRRSFCLSLASSLGVSAAADRPNFVFILADDLGYGDLGITGHPTIRTPNLDRMAVEGMRLTQCYSGGAVCVPSRAALMTGRLPIRSGMTRGYGPRTTTGLPATEVTIAAALRDAGYRTACVGKWHLGMLPGYLPTNRGFDRYFGLPTSNDHGMAGPAKFPLPLIRNIEVVETEPDQSRLTARYTEEAVEFLRSCAFSKAPFFLYLAHTFPHTPLSAGAGFRGRSLRGLYGDAVEEVDWSIGRVLSVLKELGLERNTLTLFSSDNGPTLVKGLDGGSAGLFRGGKATTWEGGWRVPLLAHWPGRIQPGFISAAFAAHVDVMPTLLSLAGVPLPAGRTYDGADLSPVLLRGEAGREALFFYYLDDAVHAVRLGRWKLHVATNAPQGDRADAGGPITRHDPPLLFDLLIDPSESRDVAASQPDLVRKLLSLLEQHRRETKGPVAGSKP